MAYKVVLFSLAERAFTELPDDKTRRVVAKALRSLADYPHPSARIEKLRAPLVGYRRRVGVYRILLDIEGGCIFVRDIKYRRDAYR